jgi:osmotically-inducible protein OsmY
MRHSALSIVVLAGAVALGAAACDRDTSAREPARDTGAAASEAARDTGAAVAGATETVDVKAALMSDDGVDASEINVDTDGSRKVVVLKGSVSTDAQRTRAAQIAEREAEGYRVDNQLIVRAR